MILLELFSGVHTLRELDDEEIESMLVSNGMGDSGDIVMAHEFQFEDKRIIIWFSDLGQGRFECSFGLKSDNPLDYPYNFNPTGTRNEFKVYGAVAQSIREFIETRYPKAVLMIGYNDRQSKRAARRVLMPQGYQIADHPSGSQIVRDEASV